MTGPLADAVSAADDLTYAAWGATGQMPPDEVERMARRISEALDDVEPPYGRKANDDDGYIGRALGDLYDRVDQWEEYYDKPHIQTVDDLQQVEYADALAVPVSWVRTHVEPSDIRMWGDFQAIRNERMEKRRKDN